MRTQIDYTNGEQIAIIARMLNENKNLIIGTALSHIKWNLLYKDEEAEDPKNPFLNLITLEKWFKSEIDFDFENPDEKRFILTDGDDNFIWVSEYIVASQTITSNYTTIQIEPNRYFFIGIY